MDQERSLTPLERDVIDEIYRLQQQLQGIEEDLQEIRTREEKLREDGRELHAQAGPLLDYLVRRGIEAPDLARHVSKQSAGTTQRTAAPPTLAGVHETHVPHGELSTSQAIVKLLGEMQRPVTAHQIVADLAKYGAVAQDATIRSYLVKLAKAGKIQKLSRGVYADLAVEVEELGDVEEDEEGPLEEATAPLGRSVVTHE